MRKVFILAGLFAVAFVGGASAAADDLDPASTAQHDYQVSMAKVENYDGGKAR